jgi:hypothetical protein
MLSCSPHKFPFCSRARNDTHTHPPRKQKNCVCVSLCPSLSLSLCVSLCVCVFQAIWLPRRWVITLPCTSIVICFCFTNKTLASCSSSISAMLNPCVDPFAAAGLLSVCVSLALVCSLSLSLSLSLAFLSRASERLPLRTGAESKRRRGGRRHPTGSRA